MGRGSFSNRGGGSSGGISGDVDFDAIIKASDNSISFNRTFTLMPKGYMPVSGKKGDLASTLDDYNINDVVVNMFRDRSGANDLNRLKSAGFEVVAQYKPQVDSTSRIPPRDYYYLKRKRS